uniref:ABC-2 type transporter transmembrane domain-containing protein n=1 Tax=Vitis vinifera TaxID=29760 RepID=F6HXD9_VITVI
MFGTMLWKLGNKWPTPTKLSNAMGSMYAAVIFIGLQNSASVQPVVDVERTVFYRELAAGMYSALAYAFSQAIVEIPYIFSQTVLYGVLVYAMISFQWTAAKIFWYLFFMFFTYSGMIALHGPCMEWLYHNSEI